MSTETRDASGVLIPAEWVDMLREACRCRWPEKRCEKGRLQFGLFCPAHRDVFDRKRGRAQKRILGRIETARRG